MKSIKAILLNICIITMILTVISIPSFSEDVRLNALLSGDISIPVTVSFSSPEYRILSQFGKERLDSLNRLIRHLSMEISIDGPYSETKVALDKDPLYTVSEYVHDNTVSAVYSFEPDNIYSRSGSQQQTVFSAFLNNQFFYINRLLDGMYPVFEKACSVFPDLTKSSTENMNYREYGKSVRKILITFPSKLVGEQFPGILSDLAENEEVKHFIEHIFFRGTQKITIHISDSGHILRINYDGVLGMTDDSMRKISLSWKCLRSTEHIKDNITLKSPTVRGYDKYNLVYIRDLDLTQSDHQILNWDFQLDYKNDDIKKKVKYNADLSFSGDILTGNATFSEKQNGEEEKITIIPEIRKENAREYSGTIEITCFSGKIVLSSVLSALHVSASTALNWPGTGMATASDIPYEPDLHTEEELQSIIDQIILRKLITLPDEDLIFLNQNIPEDDWDSIKKTLF